MKPIITYQVILQIEIGLCFCLQTQVQTSSETNLALYYKLALFHCTYNLQEGLEGLLTTEHQHTEISLLLTLVIQLMYGLDKHSQPVLISSQVVP